MNGKYHYLTQIGTGNYNEKTSELYTDLSFITTRQEIGEEASAVFNNMALQRLTSEADTMLVAPLRFKSVLLEEMDRVIAAAHMGRPASMILKNNSISDRDIILKLQEASCAGVRIDMIVRGICCVRAGVLDGWEYCGAKKAKLSDSEVDIGDYATFIGLYVRFRMGRMNDED